LEGEDKKGRAFRISELGLSEETNAEYSPRRIVKGKKEKIRDQIFFTGLGLPSQEVARRLLKKILLAPGEGGAL